MAPAAGRVLGSAFLAAIVIGSGIAAQQLSPGDIGLELFENAAATAAGLFAIILMFGPVSGGHFNPVVSFVDAAFGGLRWRDAAAYLPAQVAAASAGRSSPTSCSPRPLSRISTKHRASGAHFLSEVVATLGLLLVIFALARTGRGRLAPAAVGAYIGAAYFFTSSTSFANPAITVGRMFSNTFAGIAPSSAPASSPPRSSAASSPSAASRRLYPGITPAEAADVIVPHRSLDAGGRERYRRPAEVPSRTGASPNQSRQLREEAPCTSSPSEAATPASQRRPAGPRARPEHRGDRRRRRRLPELLHLRHPLLRLGRGRPLAQPGPPQRRRPRGDRDAAALDTLATRIDVAATRSAT